MLPSAREKPARIALSERAARRLWVVAILDLVVVAWMIAAGSWLDRASSVTTVMTLGGRHWLVLAMASGGLVLLVGLAIATQGFTSATRLQQALITLACAISVVALAGALSTVLLMITAALVLGLVLRPIFRR